MTKGSFSESSSEVRWAFFIHFGLFIKIIRRIYRDRILWALRIVLKEKGFFRKKFSQIFRIWIKPFSDFWQYLFNQVADFPLEGPGGVFWEQFFWKKNLLFQILSQKCSENGKIPRLHSVNCILRDQKNIFRNFFLRFEDLFCQFRTFSKNNSERLSKLLSMSPEHRFGKKIIFRHRGFPARLLDLQPTFSSFWLTKSRVVRQNYIFTFPKKRYFEEEQFLQNW